MSTSRKEFDKGRTLESNHANRKKQWLLWKNSVYLLPDFSLGLVSPEKPLSPRLGMGKDV